MTKTKETTEYTVSNYPEYSSDMKEAGYENPTPKKEKKEKE